MAQVLKTAEPTEQIKLGTFWKDSYAMDASCADLTSLCRGALLRHIPKVGAVCGNSARTDLCGGRRETGVPIATALDFC